MFWDDLIAKKEPIVGLSPMDGVTDAAMRYMTAKYGSKHTRCVGALHTGCVGDGVDVIFTEFVNVDALHYAKDDPTSPLASKGQGRREKLLKTFMRAREVDSHTRCVGALHTGCVGDGRWPYEVAQVFGKTPELFAEAAELVEELGFDGIDINMGCPAHKVEENGSGAGLIRTPKLAQEIIRVVKSATSLPVSVKTRIGVDSDVVAEWMESLMEARPAMISLHGRTLRQLYLGAADWEAIGRATEIVHKRGGYILGNGDIQSMEDGLAKTARSKVDGFLIGRAAEGNPGVFLQGTEPCKEQKLAWAVEHAKIFESIFKPADPPSLHELRKGTREERWFFPVRKHLAWYCKGFPGASELRAKLVQADSAAEVEEILVESGSSW